MKLKIDFDLKMKLNVAVQTIPPHSSNTFKIKGLFFSKERLLKKYPKASEQKSLFIIDNSLLYIRLNEINGDELYTIKSA